MQSPNQYRVRDGAFGTDDSAGNNGAFHVPQPDKPSKYFSVIASDGEQFLPIKGFENEYEISTLGRVYSLKRKTEMPRGGEREQGNYFLLEEKMEKGYRRVSLGHNKKVLVHRLVAEAFIPNPESLPIINHIDGDKGNNHVENLEWCSHSYNVSHAIENGLRGGKKTAEIEDIKNKLKNETVCSFAKKNNITRQTISDIKNGRHHILLQEETFRYQGIPHWEHVSVSLPSRSPTWEEMCLIKNLFWGEDETVIQYHPPKSEYVNNHQYCLHLWKPIGKTIETPPSILVGIK